MKVPATKGAPGGGGRESRLVLHIVVSRPVCSCHLRYMCCHIMLCVSIHCSIDCSLVSSRSTTAFQSLDSKVALCLLVCVQSHFAVVKSILHYSHVMQQVSHF